MNTYKVAIVTGAGTGVGAATAIALASRGYSIAINYSKSAEGARATQAACEKADADTLLLQGDVQDDGACRALVQQTVDRWGRLDALVNNAAITSFSGAANWDALDAETFQRVVGVNALGSFQMIRAAAAPLKASRGAIVNVSSVAGALGIGSSVAYIASKGAINSMTLYFARAMAPEVRVNAVCPGLITTEWFSRGVGDDNYAQMKAVYEKSVPLGTASSAEDVAEAILWLVDGARTTTGELLMLDGGMHLAKPPG